jgi:hypothetical protein
MIISVFQQSALQLLRGGWREAHPEIKPPSLPQAWIQVFREASQKQNKIPKIFNFFCELFIDNKAVLAVKTKGLINLTLKLLTD